MMQLVPSYFTVRVDDVPLPLPFLNALRQIEVETDTEQAGIFRLRFELSQTAIGDWDVLQLDIFRPRVLIQIRVHLSLPLSETLINGYVNEARVEAQTQPGTSVLEVVGMDATGALMNSNDAVMPWPQTPDSAVAAVMFGKYGIIPIVVPTPPTRVVTQTTTIQRTSDIRFLKTLARRNAYECYVQPDPLVGADTAYFGPPQIFMPPQGVLSVNFGISTNVNSFTARYDMLRPTTALAVALQPETKTPAPAVATLSADPPMGLEPTLARVLPPPIRRPTSRSAANPAELITSGQSLVNRSSRAIHGTGEVDGLRYGRVLRPGLPVAVRGAGREYSGIYYVTRVSHSISTDHYTQRFEGWRNALGLTGAELFVDPLAALN
jgi:hypothetical protein